MQFIQIWTVRSIFVFVDSKDVIFWYGLTIFSTLIAFFTNFVQFIQIDIAPKKWNVWWLFFSRFLKMLYSDMVHQSIMAHWTKITFGALEIKIQSFSSMSRLHMCCHSFLLRKIFFANRASKTLSSGTITFHVEV